jgi:hypothetical protein
MRTDSRLIGFTAHRQPVPLSKRRRTTFSIRRSLDPIKDRAHPSSRNSSTEFLRSLPSPFIFRCSASPALGLCPSSRHHSSAATIPRGASHAPLRSVLRFSQPLDGFFRSRACRLISSRSHVQGHLSSRGFSPVAATLPLRKELPPCRCCIAARTHAPTFAGSHAAHVRRLSASRPRSAPGRVLQVRLFTSPKAAPLFEFHAPPGFSLSRRRHPLSRLPSALDVTRSIFAARVHLSVDASGNHLRGVTSPCSLERAQQRSSCRTPSDRFLFRVAVHFAKHNQHGHGRGRTSLLRGLVTFWVFRAGGAFARSPCGDSSVRSCGSESHLRALQCRGSAQSFECVVFRAAKLHTSKTALLRSRLRTIRSRTSRCERSFNGHARLAAHVCARALRLAAIEPARRHVRSKRSRQLSCASSSCDAPFVLPRRGRRSVSCPRSPHDPSFRRPCIRGTWLCFVFQPSRCSRSSCAPSFDVA